MATIKILLRNSSLIVNLLGEDFMQEISLHLIQERLEDIR